ncbi:DNA-3-methyladenine glycosylase [Aliifodinibius sp. S!AR15-10]|uniref:DNA-3-methyladenine glycosylase n=1 Tax=Aliifodinibius sp. S!AR15-10 TaxID=2950437 RepID=UPI0028554ABC|nr:DNA-3-methyladenine glycosylase [Aliifodinibius sp. S!AR15-10]MDR8393052.1 DNA-3-methyladenine glycosylase [Aliifodinibius sp. S!AR15-10]
MHSAKLPESFYLNPDVKEVARNLVGKVLCTRLHGHPLTSGLIVETEAYSGRNDKACHANNGTRTERTEVMYHRGGIAYVYLCYGIHHLFNVVSNVEGQADAVLIRAIKPLDGITTILQRRNAEELTPAVAAGPGRLTQALGISTDNYGTNLTGDQIWIEDRGSENNGKIEATLRIGVDYAGEHARRPWRFSIKDHLWVSK